MVHLKVVAPARVTVIARRLLHLGACALIVAIARIPVVQLLASAVEPATRTLILLQKLELLEKVTQLLRLRLDLLRCLHRLFGHVCVVCCTLNVILRLGLLAMA